MDNKSSFKSDLEKEQKLALLLDTYYKENLNHYTFERVSDIAQQLAGIDVIFKNSATQQSYYLDEKAQLDYVNEDLPTFAFELCYQKNGKVKEGWLFDTAKKTDFYALVTGIYSDAPNTFTSCKITFVNRKKLIGFLKNRNIDKSVLDEYLTTYEGEQGKIELRELKAKTEGYLYFSNLNKVEKPINLILRLEFLLTNGLAKRLV
ncbi:hypothetical protein [Costertonia aggregata]|uniref:Uncharacterized protein n=1 Tax=Costertonia aggregata TaxID=343403 RepID=A0A7H9APH9_9FLAO|nr:hypothetical protein [Costertonia aggregata]QLG45369.1 hypothetical protein HYG79_08420 [Costertonia aggregata]